MKGQILFIANRYGVDTSANGICVQNVVDELINLGYKCYVITDAFDDEDFREINNELFSCCAVKAASSKVLMKKIDSSSNNFCKAIYKTLFVLKRLISILIFPNISPLRTRKVYKKACSLIDNNEIDKVVCVYRPYDSIRAGILLKKRYHDDITLITYHLDIMNSPGNSNGFLKMIKTAKNKLAIEDECNNADEIILPPSAKVYLKEKSKKIVYADFPLFKIQKGEESGIAFNNDTFNMVYIGSLDSSNRNPLELFNLLNKANEKMIKRIHLHIWGSISGEEIINEIKLSNFINYHGVIENRFVLDILSKADILLNMSNKVTFNMVPSKIFQLFSTGKPIIDFVFNQKDASLEYFRKYGNVYYVLSGSKEININDLMEVLNNDFPTDAYTLENLFMESTPKYTANCILHCSHSLETIHAYDQ